MSASSILPVECWERVLDVLHDPLDLLTASQVCFLWEDILERRNPLFGFALVLPHLFPLLSKNDILNCSQVCHSWNKTLDDYCSHLSETKKECEIQSILHNRDQESLIHFINEIDNPQNAPVNLSIYRNVNLIVDMSLHEFWDDTDGDFHRQMKKYLENVGGLICRLSFDRLLHYNWIAMSSSKNSPELKSPSPKTTFTFKMH